MNSLQIRSYYKKFYISNGIITNIELTDIELTFVIGKI